MDKDYNTISNQYIKFDQVKSIVEEAQKCNMHISLYKDDKWIVEKLDKWAQIEADITGIKAEFIQFDDIINSQEYKTGFNKVLLIRDENKVSEMYKTLNSKFAEDLNVYTSKPTYLEIMNKNVSKTEAIKQLLDLYKIDKSEVIAIGDNFNDMDMLKFADVGIDMGNAPSNVKEVSDDVTLTNDEDGIAEAINKYFY